MTLHILDGIVFSILLVAFYVISKKNDEDGLYPQDIGGRGFEYPVMALAFVFFMFFIYGDYDLSSFMSKIKFVP